MHYDGFARDSTFLWPAEELNDWDRDALRDWMGEFSTRAGLSFSSERQSRAVVDGGSLAHSHDGPGLGMGLMTSAPPRRDAKGNEPDLNVDQTAPAVFEPSSKSTVIVVGMHRSVTSALTEALASTLGLAASAPEACQARKSAIPEDISRTLNSSG